VVSRRYRDAQSVGKRLSGIQTTIENIERSKELGDKDIVSGNLGDNSVDSRALAPGSVYSLALGHGAVGTEHLGVVNEIESDSTMTISAPDTINLDSPEVVASGQGYQNIDEPVASVPFADLATGVTPVWDETAGRYIARGALTGENLIINGDFRVNQREVTSGTTYSGYSLDRWKKMESLPVGSLGAIHQVFELSLSGVAGRIVRSRRQLRSLLYRVAITFCRGEVRLLLASMKLEAPPEHTQQVLLLSPWPVLPIWLFRC